MSKTARKITPPALPTVTADPRVVFFASRDPANYRSAALIF